MSESSRTPEQNWMMREIMAVTKPDADELFYSEQEKKKRKKFIERYGVVALLNITRIRFNEPRIFSTDIARNYHISYDKVRAMIRGLVRFGIGQAELEDLLKDQRFDGVEED